MRILPALDEVEHRHAGLGLGAKGRALVPDRLGRGLELPRKLRGLRPARTSSTIRARNSAGYGGRLFGIADFPLPSDEGSTKACQLHNFTRP